MSYLTQERETLAQLLPGLSAAPEAVAFPGPDEVHLWVARPSEAREQYLRAFLAEGEKRRADRFHFAAERRRFTVTRALLRIILGQYLHEAPEGLCFEYNEFGKPSVGPSQNPRGISFNVAHSGDRSLLAFGVAPYLGVDVEDVRVERNVADLARAVFSPSQYRSFLLLPDALRKRAFLQAWTRKEAVVKALGGGLSLPLDGVEVERACAPEWAVRNIDVDGPYAAAVAVKARRIQLSRAHIARFRART
jgi:4'-phosphopantetheinyl transferase